MSDVLIITDDTTIEDIDHYIAALRARIDTATPLRAGIIRERIDNLLEFRHARTTRTAEVQP